MKVTSWVSNTSWGRGIKATFGKRNKKALFLGNCFLKHPVANRPENVFKLKLPDSMT